MIRADVILCKFHARSKFYATRGIEVFSKDSNSIAALDLWFFLFLGFLFFSFLAFPFCHSDHFYCAFLVVNVVVNLRPVLNIYGIR